MEKATEVVFESDDQNKALSPRGPQSENVSECNKGALAMHVRPYLYRAQ